MAESDLSYPQSLVLFELREVEQATMGEVASSLNMSPSMVSRLVDQLVEKSMVVRKRVPEDRRVVVVSLSIKGREYADRLYKFYEEEMKAILSTLKQEELVNFISFLKELDERLS